VQRQSHPIRLDRLREFLRNLCCHFICPGYANLFGQGKQWLRHQWTGRDQSCLAGTSVATGQRVVFACLYQCVAGRRFEHRVNRDLHRQPDQLFVGRVYELDQHLHCHLGVRREQILFRLRPQWQQYQFADFSEHQLAASRQCFVRAGHQQCVSSGRSQHHTDRDLHGQSDQLLVGRVYELDQHLRCHIGGRRKQDLFGVGEQWHEYQFADFDRCQLAGGWAADPAVLRTDHYQFDSLGGLEYHVDRCLYGQPNELLVGRMHQLDRNMRRCLVDRGKQDLFGDSQQCHEHHFTRDSRHHLVRNATLGFASERRLYP
jgi:hypothetical protein